MIGSDDRKLSRDAYEYFGTSCSHNCSIREPRHAKLYISRDLNLDPGKILTEGSRSLSKKKKVFVILLSIFELAPAPIRAHSRAYPRSLRHTPTHVRTFSHLLMFEYQQENDKSQDKLIFGRFMTP